MKLFLLAILTLLTSCVGEFAWEVANADLNVTTIVTSGFLIIKEENSHLGADLQISFQDNVYNEEDKWHSVPCDGLYCKVKIPTVLDESVRNLSEGRNIAWVTYRTYEVRLRLVSKSGAVISERTMKVKKGLNKDYNGDGYADVLVGENPLKILDKADDVTKGRVVVYYGGPNGVRNHDDPMAKFTVLKNPCFNENGELDTDTCRPGHANPNNDFGAMVEAVGDINGDGFGDILVGAPGGTINNQVLNCSLQTGKVYIYYGHANGFYGPNEVMDPDHGTRPLRSLNDCLPAEGGAQGRLGNRFGQSGAGIGDSDGDGFDDFVVGAYGSNKYGAQNFYFPNFYGNREVPRGNLYLFHGGPDGSVTYQVEALPFPKDANGNIRTDVFTLGGSVAAAGDVNDEDNQIGVHSDINGDGAGDIIVGANYQYTHPDLPGRAFLYLSQRTQSQDGASIHVSYKVVEIEKPNDGKFIHNFGLSVSGAGDVNNDGRDDLVIGAPAINWHLDKMDVSRRGRAFVYLQDEKGSFPLYGVVELGYPEPHGEMRFGQSVAGHMDLNGDGISDIVVGTRDDNVFVAPPSERRPNQNHFGRAYVYYGLGKHLERYGNEPALGGSRSGRDVVSSEGTTTDSLADYEKYLSEVRRVRGFYSYPGTVIGYPDYPGAEDAVITRFGTFMSALGDTNGNGMSELVVAAHEEAIDGVKSGSVFVYSGTRRYLDVKQFVRLTSPSPQRKGRFGYSVGSADELLKSIETYIGFLPFSTPSTH